MARPGPALVRSGRPEQVPGRRRDMLVLVTGATDSSVTRVAALRRDGHDVRILVRDPQRIAPALDPHGVSVSVALGDMTDRLPSPPP